MLLSTQSFSRMSIVSDNIKKYRKKLQLTQGQLSEKLGIKRSLLGAYEEGRADPRLSNLLKMAEVFNTSVDHLITDDSSDIKEEALKSLEKAFSDDQTNSFDCILVEGSSRMNYIQDTINQSINKNQYKKEPFGISCERCFRVDAPGVTPATSDSFIYCNQQEPNAIKDGDAVVVVEKSNIYLRRVFPSIHAYNSLILLSDNKIYPPVELSKNDIIEIWKVRLIVNEPFFPSSHVEKEVSLFHEVRNLKKELSELKNRFR